MKKIFLIIIIGSILFSCNNDDDSQPSVPLVFGEAGVHTVNTYTLNNYDYTTVYYPSDIALMTEKTPVLFFISGWYSAPAIATTYDSLLRFIASKGYTVIYTDEGATTDETFTINAIDTFMNASDNTLQNDILAHIDTSKIGVLGHSVGGGLIFPELKHLTELGYGVNGRFVMALDPWFAFGMDSNAMQSLPANTNAVIIKFGIGGNNDADGTDARIPLTEYSLLTSITANNKDYQIYDQENADHSYPKGTRPYSEMQGILKPLDALMLYTFSNQSNEVRNIALENGNDDPYNSGIQEVLSNYQYPCDGANTLIDYCVIVP